MSRRERSVMYKLCYIEHNSNFAWFTTAEIADQWGDDWDDAPYWCNADGPYEWDYHRHCDPYDCDPYELMRIAFWHPWYETPSQRNACFSVQEINARITPWLKAERFAPIHAGCSLEDFKHTIRSSGGEIYVLELES
jgi:hypothetical protein